MTSRLNPTPRCFTTRRLLATALAAPLLAAGPTNAEVSTTGSVSPNPLFVTAQDDLIVGTPSGSPGTVDITDGSFVVSNRGRIYGQGSRVTVSGAGSAWLMLDDFFVGQRRDSSLWVLDGGSVTNQNTFMGASNPSNVGRVFVDGAGSTWTNHGNLYLGGQNERDALDGFVTITNGGVVNVDGMVFSSASTANVSRLHLDQGTLNAHSGVMQLHALTGTGTINADHWLLNGDNTLASAADLPAQLLLQDLPGRDITINLAWAQPLDQLDVFGIDTGSLTLQAGMAVTSRDGHVRYTPNAALGVMTVDGPGTVWTVERELFVGNWGAGELNITGGGSVVLNGAQNEFNNRSRVGYEPGGHGTVTVDGAGSVFDSSNSSQDLNLGSQGQGHLNVLNGGTALLRGLTVHHGSLRVAGAGSTLEATSIDVNRSTHLPPSDIQPALIFSSGATVRSNGGWIGGDRDDPVVAIVDGPGTTWTIDDALRVGQVGAAEFRLTGSATLHTARAFANNDRASSLASRLLVSGAGSAWHNTGDFFLGDDGPATLTISDGGTVTVGGLFDIHNDDSPTPYSYVELDNGTLTVGDGFLTARTVLGTGTLNTNTFLLEGTHTVTDFADLPGTMQVAIQPGQDITVNARWEANTGINFQAFGVDGGDITMADGFALRSSDSYVGYTEGASGRMTLTGASTTWTVSTLSLGRYGSGTLVVEDGAVLESRYLTYLGYETGSSGSVMVSGVGSHFNADSGFSTDVGRYGGGEIRVEAGGLLTTRRTYLGRENGATGSVTVTGVGSAWQADSISVGGDDTGAGVLSVLDGGHVTFESIGLGSEDAPLTGQLFIDGPGSRAEATLSGVYTGGEDSARITITNGGALVAATEARLNGQALIDGADSRWTMGGALRVGNGHAGVLTVTNGGELASGESYIGYNGYSSGSDTEGDVLVDGAGSIWTLNGALRIGGDFYDRGNEGRGSLTVSNGGMVNVASVLLVDRSSAGSLLTLDNGTINVDAALFQSDQITGTGTINADFWLIRGDHDITDFSTLPSQFVYDQLPNQNVTVNVAWSDPSQSFAFFGVDFGTVSIGGGLAIQSTNGYLANNPGTTADLTLTGAGTSWDVTETLEVGGRGDATLRVHDGAQLDAEWIEIAAGVGRTALMEVSGSAATASAQTLLIGDLGDGTLRITAGGGMNVQPDTSGNGQVILGEQAGAFGELHLSGVGSEFAADTRVEAGVRGTGAVVVEDGAAFDSGYSFYLGYDYNGVGGLVVDDATWVGDAVLIGYDGTGTVELRNGAAATARYARLGSEPKTKVNGITYHSSGTVLVEGIGTTWDLVDDLSVAHRGKGQLDIVAGGVVNSRRGFVGSQYNADGNAVVSGAGSAWHVAQDLNVYSHIDGGLRVESGGLVQAQTSAVQGAVTVVGPGSVFRSHDLAVNSGGIVHINEGGRVEVTNNMSQASSTSLMFEVGASGPGLIQVGGDYSINTFAALAVTLRDEASITLGDQFTLIDIAGTRSGSSYYAIENQLLAQRDGVDLLMTYAAGDGNDIGLTTALSGDLNGDGLADGDDLHLIFTHWGQSVTPGERSQGDLYADGYIAGSDLLLAPQAQPEIGDEVPVQAIDGPDPFAYDHILEGQILAAGDGIDLLLTYLAGDGNDVAIFAALTGDINGDNFVGAADLDVLLANWGDPVTAYDRAAGDLSGDGLVGQGDLQVVLDHWGNNTSNTGNVPEPTSALLLALGTFVLRRRRRVV